MSCKLLSSKNTLEKEQSLKNYQQIDESLLTENDSYIGIEIIDREKNAVGSNNEEINYRTKDAAIENLNKFKMNVTQRNLPTVILKIS